MKQDRRSFIRAGGLTLAASGIVPAFLQSCKSESDDSGLSDMTAGVEPLGDTDYLARQEKVKKQMQEAGVDALWIEGGVNMKYFFDVNWWMSERVFGVVLPAKAEPVWVCPGFEAPRAEESIRFGNDLRTWEEHNSPYKLLDDVFEFLAAVKVAIDPNVRSFVTEGIRKE